MPGHDSAQHRMLGSIVMLVALVATRCSNDTIVKTFRITGLDGVFTLVETVEDALAVRSGAEAA